MRTALKVIYTLSLVVLTLLALEGVGAADGWPYGCCNGDGGGSDECASSFVCCTKPAHLGNCQQNSPDYCWKDTSCSLSD